MTTPPLRTTPSRSVEQTPAQRLLTELRELRHALAENTALLRALTNRRRAK
jgi:hypothetical protein